MGKKNRVIGRPGSRTLQRLNIWSIKNLPLSLKLMPGDPSLIKTEVWFQMKHCNHCYSFHSTHYQGTGGLWKPAKCLPEEFHSHKNLFLPITDRNPVKGKAAWQGWGLLALHSMFCLGWWKKHIKVHIYRNSPCILELVINTNIKHYIMKASEKIHFLLKARGEKKPQNITMQSKLILSPRRRGGKTELFPPRNPMYHRRCFILTAERKAL